MYLQADISDVQKARQDLEEKFRDLQEKLLSQKDVMEQAQIDQLKKVQSL